MIIVIYFNLCDLLLSMLVSTDHVVFRCLFFHIFVDKLKSNKIYFTVLIFLIYGEPALLTSTDASESF